MSTVMEIEAAILRLSPDERAELRERVFGSQPARPKTGGELAVLWPSRFHLSAIEAEEFARDLEAVPQTPPKAPAWE